MVLYYQLLPPLHAACRAVWEVLRDVEGWLGVARRAHAAPSALQGRNGQILEAQPVGPWSFGGTMFPLKIREILVKCRAEHPFTLSFLLALFPHQHVETQPQGDTEGQVDAGGTPRLLPWGLTDTKAGSQQDYGNSSAEVSGGFFGLPE